MLFLSPVASVRPASACADCACVLVAGGLGERLGYSGIKVALPTEITTGTTYIGLYCKEILALQAASNKLAGTANTVPLAIMTSDDTHQRTVDALAADGYYGMADGQVPHDIVALFMLWWWHRGQSVP
jgi:UDP-N-acetylglucosamine pyrophosphorylase